MFVRLLWSHSCFLITGHSGQLIPIQVSQHPVHTCLCVQNQQTFLQTQTFVFRILPSSHLHTTVSHSLTRYSTNVQWAPTSHQLPNIKFITWEIYYRTRSSAIIAGWDHCIVTNGFCLPPRCRSHQTQALQRDMTCARSHFSSKSLSIGELSVVYFGHGGSSVGCERTRPRSTGA